ncbi:MFS transporter [Streptomyces sp. XY431]|uniref:MFS transporter n=1 Tax=Streptomyces sp. XY431 TaxID=1415562 RepID=UPI0006AEF2D6|nr:MFS transporter [Streptomyces sp. XY431]KOV39006.1 MFS transporter [Streptomyces sp. XY431]
MHTAQPGRWRALASLCAAQFMLIVDVTVVNVALPSIAADLSLSRSALTWVFAAYSLTFGGLLLLGGRLADGFGRRRTFLLGLAVFTAASLLSGLAWTGGVLIAARAVQGVGAALLSPAAMSIITTTFHGPERSRALGVWGAIGGTGAAVGVLLGGALTAGPGWAWIFFINVPVGLAVLAVLPGLVPATPPQHRPAGLDVPGTLTGTAAAALLVYGLVRAGDAGWASPVVLVTLAAAVGCAIAFVLIARTVREPLLPPALLTNRPVMAGALVMLAASSLLLAGFFLSSWYAQHRLGLSALRTGLVFLPAAVGTILGAHGAAHALGRLGARPTAAIGFAVSGAGAALLARLPADGTALRDLMPGFILLSVGLGAGFVCATTTAMRGVDHHRAGLVSGIVNTGHELGGALGVALASVLAASSLSGTGGMSGLHAAFTACAVAAFAMAALALWLVPPGRPEATDGPVFAH